VLLVVAAGPALGMAQGAAAAPADRQRRRRAHRVPATGPPARSCCTPRIPVPDDAGLRRAHLLDAVGPWARRRWSGALGGGASSLRWRRRAVTLADKRAVTAALLASGADITLPSTRSASTASRIKGRRPGAPPRGAAAVWTLLLSDVAGDDPAIIASGRPLPTRPPSPMRTPSSARWLAPRCGARGIRAHLDAGLAGRVEESVKPGTVLERRDPGPRGNRTAGMVRQRGGPPARVRAARHPEGLRDAEERAAPAASSPRSTAPRITGQSPSWQEARRRLRGRAQRAQRAITGTWR
jgi:hypothetical protein